MGEPARKLEDIEPDIRPNLNVLQGGGQSTPERASLKALNNLESNPEKLNTGSIDEQESNGSNVIPEPWANNVSGTTSDKPKSGGRFKFAKKKGPLTAIILTLVGGGIGIGGLLSPSLLIVNLKEMMVNKFNTQLTSMDIRNNKILKSRILGNSSCGTIIKCKISTMSEYQVKRFAKSDITVNFDEEAGTNLLGRKKIKSLSYDGNEITAAQLSNKLNTDVKFRSAVKKAYNPLFAGFADKIWNKTLFKFRITESGVKLTGATDEEKLKNIQKETKNPSNINDSLKQPTLEDLDENGNKKYSGANDPNFTKDTNSYTQLKNAGSEIVEGATEVLDTGVKSTTKMAANVVKITGIADDACVVYNSIRVVGFAAKTVRAVQLARYAMIFLTVADQIKAGGNPDPEDVSYLGSVLTTESVQKDFDGTVIKDGSGNAITKSATDSYGYKYAAYGETGAMPSSATQFLAGAGLTGTLIGVTSSINSILDGSPKTVCKTLNNIFIQIGSAAVGIGLAVITGGISFTVKMAVQIGSGVAVAIALSYLPALLQDIVAGVVIDEGTVGELAGDAITSGSGTLMSNVASDGGNAPLTVTQAIAYDNLSKEIASQYATEDSLAYNQLDISNSNTFLGNIVSKISPYIANITSLPKSILSLSSLISNSLSPFSPTARAANVNQYSVCEDTDYKDLNLATDPFCNLIYGIPTNTLQNISPEEVVDVMINNDQVDTITGEAKPGSAYETFLKECTNRENPIGYTGQNYEEDDGATCIINENNSSLNKYFYLYQIDKRILDGIDGEDTILNTAINSNLNANIGFYNGNNIDQNIAKESSNKATINKTQNKTSSIIRSIIEPLNFNPFARSGNSL